MDIKKVNWNKKLWPPSSWTEENKGQQEFVRASSFFNITDPKFIFIHIGKNAGTSIHRKVLSPIFKSGNNSINIENKLDDDYLSSFFKFTVIRNPWDRMVSCFTYFKKHQGFEYNHSSFCSLINKDFTFFIKNLAWDENGNCTNKHWINQDLMTHDKFSGKSWINFFLRFNNLNQDWVEVKKQLNIEVDLPHVNNSRKDNSYKPYYTEETKKIVQKVFEKEIDLFKFSY